MKDILDQMEEHIAAIRNLQMNYSFHSKKLEKLMRALIDIHPKNIKVDEDHTIPSQGNN